MTPGKSDELPQLVVSATLCASSLICYGVVGAHDEDFRSRR